MEEVITMVSEDIKSFLDFVEESRKLHAFAMDRIKLEEKRQTDLLHAIEFEASARSGASSAPDSINAG